MGTLFMVNPPKRKKRRTAAQRRATAKMIAANKRRRKGTKVSTRKRSKSRRRTAAITPKRRKRVTTMARKRGRKRASARRRSTTRRRRSTARRRSPVTRLRRNSVYLTNPRRRRRRRSSYRRNPPVFAALKQGAMDAGATLVGGAVARVVTGFVPLPKTGLAGVATGLGVALGVGIAARKVVKGDTARFIVAGAMQVPIKSLITTFVPGAGAYLGDYDNIGAYALPSGNGMGDYLTPGGANLYTEAEDTEVGVYE